MSWAVAKKRRMAGRYGAACLLCWLLCCGPLATPIMADETPLASPPADAAPQSMSAANPYMLEDSYQHQMELWRRRKLTDTVGVRLAIPGGSYSTAGGGFQVVPELAGRHGSILRWEAEDTWVEYLVEVPIAGLYQIELDYLALPGRNSSIQRMLRIDGAYPYVECKRLQFFRVWRESGPPLVDSLGDQYNRRPVEVRQWQTTYLEHPDCLTAEPLRFFLVKGPHRLRFESVREPMALAELRVVSPRRLESYAEYQERWHKAGARAAAGVSLRVQAEEMYQRSSPMIRRWQDRDPLTEPRAGRSIVLNSLDGGNWKEGGAWASWRVRVPRTGLYRLDFRFLQVYRPDFAAQRTLYIDGRVPFAEAMLLDFPYDAAGWQTMSAGGKEPYLFYLTAGEHVIKLQNRNGAVGPIMDRVTSVIKEMSRLNLDVLQVTGPVTTDSYRDWRLVEQIPNMGRRLRNMVAELDGCVATLRSIAGRYPQSAAELEQVREQLRSIAREPDSMPRRLTQYRDSQARLGGWIINLMYQGLSLDYLQLVGPKTPLPRARAGMIARVRQIASDLWHSFFRDYTLVGSFSGGRVKAARTLRVWVAYPRDYARIIKELADEDFTPRTGIRIKINILPVGNLSALLLATNAGRAPDVCLGTPTYVPVEYAIRHGGCDLSQFSDFEEVKRRFRPGALTPLTYLNGVWALPENQDFWLLFYRKDILAGLGLKVPETWDEVLAMIPRLQQQGMNFWYPEAAIYGNEYTPFLFQSGGDFYTPDCRRSALNTPAALNGFKLWTQFYTDYNIPKKADFYNRFRTGEMPIGVANYGMYSLLSVGAPELAGWWQVAPLPGLRRTDARGAAYIDRSMGGYANVATMFASTKDKEAGWEFLKWWTSAEIQVRFGLTLESVVGVEARWNSANQDAIRMLPWPKRDLDAIIEQWRWFKNPPVVIGGYITGRHVYNAWNQVVVVEKDGEGETILPREALEDAVRYIDLELARKQLEFPEQARMAGGTGGAGR